MKTYIQRRDGKNLETVDEFTSTREARAMVREYQIADRSARYYMSSRPCKAWRDK
jgi:hypothetical protein